MKAITCALAALSMMLASGSAMAAEPNGRTVEIELDGVDLTDPVQMERVKKSIRSAMRKVCSNRHTNVPAVLDEEDGCRKLALEDAMRQLEKKQTEQARVLYGG
ncbi:UrcA family protein [Croceicoccus pelagius]|uniref:UrcA family protein n=1 Tax=Croceicoccus pelagius TaxID=1703341 RepID=A0A916Y978_9SPHN|nr:UrcA family protein [Croceicoccus pelagius]GGD36089.1 hypothetical protein GCM10010989_07760 [Croceicoccus pelagius]